VALVSIRHALYGSRGFGVPLGRQPKKGMLGREYFIDRDGYPVLTTDGRPVHFVGTTRATRPARSSCPMTSCIVRRATGHGGLTESSRERQILTLRGRLATARSTDILPARPLIFS
jgi:hypothetical protein